MEEKTYSVRVEKNGFLLERVGKRVRRARRHDDVVALLCVDVLVVWEVEAQCASVSLGRSN